MQGSEGMYEWLAQDLAERGYVVLTYDVQGQGTSETLPHEDSPLTTHCRSATRSPSRRTASDSAARACRRSSSPTSWSAPRTRSTSSPRPRTTPTPTRASDGAELDSAYNPFWRLFDRSPDRPGDARRTTGSRSSGTRWARPRSSKVQAHRPPGRRPWWRSTSCQPSRRPLDGAATCRRPALAIQSEYGFTVSRGSSAAALADPAALARRPDPSASERPATTPGDGRGRLDARRAARLDAPGVHRHPAGAAGQPLRPGAHQRLRAALAGPLPQAPDNGGALLGTRFRYLEPAGDGAWAPVTPRPRPTAELLLLLARTPLGSTARDGDITDVGC